METRFSLLFRNTRKRLGCNEQDLALLLDIDENELRLIENYQLFPDSQTLSNLDRLNNLDRALLSYL